MTRFEKLEIWRSSARANIWLAFMLMATVVAGVFDISSVRWAFDRIHPLEWQLMGQIDLSMGAISLLFLWHYRNMHEQKVVAAMFLVATGMIGVAARTAAIQCKFVAGEDPFYFIGDQSLLLLVSAATFAYGIKVWRPWTGFKRRSSGTPIPVGA